MLNLGLCGRERPAAEGPVAGPPKPLVLAAGPGRVEPLSEEISVSAPLAGTLERVSIEEGDHVARGQVIAVIENSEFLARIRSAEAEFLRLREAELRRVIDGARGQERRGAAATLTEAEAVLENANSELSRRRVY